MWHDCALQTTNFGTTVKASSQDCVYFAAEWLQLPVEQPSRNQSISYMRRWRRQAPELPSAVCIGSTWAKKRLKVECSRASCESQHLRHTRNTRAGGGGRIPGVRVLHALGAADGHIGRRGKIGHGDAAEVVHEEISRHYTHAVGDGQRLAGGGGSGLEGGREGGSITKAGGRAGNLLGVGEEEVRIDRDDGGDDAEPGEEEWRNSFGEIGARCDPDEKCADKIDGCRRERVN